MGEMLFLLLLSAAIIAGIFAISDRMVKVDEYRKLVGTKGIAATLVDNNGGECYVLWRGKPFVINCKSDRTIEKNSPILIIDYKDCWIVEYYPSKILQNETISINSKA